MWIKRFIVFHNKRHLKDMGEKEITDFSYNHIIVREGKGDKDRITMLPESLNGPLQLQITRVKEIHDENLKQGFGRVSLPDAPEKKHPNAPKEFAWQYVFPNLNEPEERPKLGNIKIGLNTLQKAEFETLLKIFLLKMQECFL